MFAIENWTKAGVIAGVIASFGIPLVQFLSRIIANLRAKDREHYIKVDVRHIANDLGYPDNLVLVTVYNCSDYYITIKKLSGCENCEFTGFFPKDVAPPPMGRHGDYFHYYIGKRIMLGGRLSLSHTVIVYDGGKPISWTTSGDGVVQDDFNQICLYPGNKLYPSNHGSYEELGYLCFLIRLGENGGAVEPVLYYELDRNPKYGIVGFSRNRKKRIPIPFYSSLGRVGLRYRLRSLYYALPGTVRAIVYFILFVWLCLFLFVRVKLRCWFF